MIQALTEILLTQFFPQLHAIIALIHILLVASLESRAQYRYGFNWVLWQKCEHTFANVPIYLLDGPFPQVVDLSVIEFVV